MKRLWDELDDLSEVPICTCAPSCKAIKKTTALADRQRLMHFLMHLNENYESIRGQILLLDPLSTVNKAYSMIQRVETQRNVTSNITANREIVANVTKFGTHSFGESNPVGNAFVAQNGPKGKRDFKKPRTGSNRFCDHCQRSGHITEQCFKIIRYPDWYQGPKEGTKPQPQPQRNFRSNANLVQSQPDTGFETPFEDTFGGSLTASSGPTTSTFSSKVDNHLVQALAQEMMRLMKPKHGGEVQSAYTSAFAHFAGIAPLSTHSPISCAVLHKVLGS